MLPWLKAGEHGWDDHVAAGVSPERSVGANAALLLTIGLLDGTLTDNAEAALKEHVKSSILTL